MKLLLSTMATAICLSLGVSLDSHAQAQSLSSFNETFAKMTQSKEPQGLRLAAEAGLRSTINELTRDLKAGHLPSDFPIEVNDLSELKQAKLGYAFEVHTIHPQTLLTGGRPMEQMVTGTGIWNFVITIDNAPVALLEMEKSYGKWVVNGVGGAKLAQDVHAAAQNHSAKDAFRFVRVYQATADFMEVKDSEKKARYVPLIAARETLKMPLAMGSATNTLSNGSDILTTLQNTVRANIARLPR